MSRSRVLNLRSPLTVKAVVCISMLMQMVPTPGAAQEVLPGGELVPSSQLPSILASRYTIQVGDVLEIAFFKTEDMNREVTVGPDGEIYLPLVGRVKVLGRTVDDVTEEITRGYEKEMINPQITVSVAEFSGLEVYVSGEVWRPGMIPYRGGLTLTQALAAAGGFNDRARRKEVLLIRPGPENEPVGSIVNVKDIQRKGELSKDVLLAPLDIVYVHHKKIVNVNIFMQQYISDNLPRFGPWMWYLPGYAERTTD